MKSHVAILIRDEDNRFLFVRRAFSKSTLPGIWAFPSGTLEEGEEINSTAVREAMEELSIRVNVVDNLGICDLLEFSVRLHFLVCDMIGEKENIKYDNSEFDRVSWMSFEDFFRKFSDNEIGHGLVFLRKNPQMWEEYK